MEPSSINLARETKESYANAPSTNNRTNFCKKLRYFGKLAQTILFSPPTTLITLGLHAVKMLTWVPVKAGCYKIAGYHTESAGYFEKESLDTIKALRDFLFIPSIAKRAFLDLIAKPENFVDDLSEATEKEFLQVPCRAKMLQFSSYLHGCKSFRVLHPEAIQELPANSDPDLKAVNANKIFQPDVLAINFGLPNVATFVTEKEQNGSIQTVKVDAFSLKRKPMEYHPTNGKIQSGLFFVPTNIPKEALARFKDAAKSLQGRKDITCVNTNCRVLKEAGFSIEGVNMDEVVFPNTLMEHLLFRNVFYTGSDGVKHKVHFQMVNTTGDSIESLCEKIDSAVVGTQCRHSRRNADTEENRKARGAAAKALIALEESQLKAQTADEQELKEGVRDAAKRKISISVPSFIGNAAARIWGRHTIYEVDLSDKRAEITQAFQQLSQGPTGMSVKLHPFPQKKPNLSTRIKRDFLFSGPMIRFLRRHMMGRVDTFYLNTQNLFQHLKSNNGERFNYVLLDDKVVLARIQVSKTDEAHKKNADWALCKHALLSARQDVNCSGEVWYDPQEGTYMMNRDSGTYQPSPEHLNATVGLANYIFGLTFKTAHENGGH